MPAKGSNRATGRVWQAAALPFALDLDGVIWLADEPIAGAADAVARLRARGRSRRVRHQQLEPARRRGGGEARPPRDPGGR